MSTETENVDIDAILEAAGGEGELDIDSLMTENTTANTDTAAITEREEGKQLQSSSHHHPRSYPSGTRSPSGLSITLKAILGSTELTIGELEKLSSGDLLKLNAFESDLVDLVDVCGVKCASGRIGVEDGQYVIEIIDTDSNEG